MDRLFALMLFFGFCVLLPLGLLRVFFDLSQRVGPHAPALRNQGSMIQDQGAQQSGG